MMIIGRVNSYLEAVVGIAVQDNNGTFIGSSVSLIRALTASLLCLWTLSNNWGWFIA